MPYSVGSSGYSGDLSGGKEHGSARWMLPEEANALKFYDYYPGSIIVGQDSQGRLACFNRQGHILVLAPPRAGKGIGFVQPNLAGYQGSMVVTDPKGENAAVSHRYRRDTLKQNVIVLDPTEKLKSYGINPPVPTHGFNPLAVFDHADYVKVVDDIERIADALLVAKEGEKEQHWRDGGRNFLKGILTYLVFFVDVKDHNLIMFSRLANGLELPVEDIFLILTHNNHPNPIMADVIAKAGSWWDTINVNERKSFVSMALRSLSWLNSPVWHDHLTRSDFHPYDLKEGKTTVYIVCPFEKLEDYSPWFRLVLSSCIVAVLRAPNRSKIPTLFMLDEYAKAIGRLALLEDSLTHMEGMGGRYAMIFQSLGQIQTLWPEPTYHTNFASAGAHIFFNASDKLTSEYISSYIGKYGAMTHSGGGIGYVQRDLLTPDEVRTLPEDDQIAFVRNYRPAWLGKLDARTHKAFKGCFDPNPAYSVLPAAPKALLSGTSAAPRLSAADALARAKSAKPQAQASRQSVLEMLGTKYPDADFRVEDDFYGYDATVVDPATGRAETVFTPVMHKSMLNVL